jgi:uncharacterized tellurite resistance protein B-like protein
MSDDARQIIAKWIYKQTLNFKEVPLKTVTHIYSKIVLLCANADGEITPGERDWIIGLAAAKGVSDSVIEEIKNYQATDNLEDLLSSVDMLSKYARRSIIYDAIATCSADAEYSEDEKAMVRKVASIMEISEDVVEQIEAIYIEEKKLFKKKIKVLYPEGHPLLAAN